MPLVGLFNYSFLKWSFLQIAKFLGRPLNCGVIIFLVDIRKRHFNILIMLEKQVQSSYNRFIQLFHFKFKVVLFCRLLNFLVIDFQTYVN